ncbi:Fatty acid hydroxylase superfamily [Rhynchospora pubera]|uniref:aldehyde oxygenase (deformylating) n=1 Tax=Rhynchospora pubera TaxID=906938 RepID=A0AAV8E4I9_9POAL|nr:Fatty acid hydroxylase superfamily [Rhynchospora pubera]
MASEPGPLTNWPWHGLGNFKYALLAPWFAHSMHKFATSKTEERDLLNLLIIPVLLLRLLYGQLWISISRFQTARSKRRIVNKSLDFDQVDRERNWDDQIILTALLFYGANSVIPGTQRLPWWNTKGIVLATLLHIGPVEFLYYWFHRALHHHFLYSRYHSHHHASIVTEPITSVIHPFAEEFVYFLLFAIPLLSMAFCGVGSIVGLVGYLIYIDFMNYMGHCNFEMVPSWLFRIFPPLKYFMYTPSFHSIHHTKFQANYSLFMPLYDYIYNTYDKTSDSLYERSLKRQNEEKTNVVHLTHLTSIQSIFHLRLGFASVASRPYIPGLHLWILSPLSYLLVVLTWIFGTTFTLERNYFNNRSMETWVIPRYSFQYMAKLEKGTINRLIEKAILNAEKMGAKVISLGLFNQGEELNRYGETYISKNPSMKIKIVDGTGLAAALVLNSIPDGTERVLLIGKLDKLAYYLSLVICQRKIQVEMVQKDLYEFLKLQLPQEMKDFILLSDSYMSKVWLVGEELRYSDQMKAAKGVLFIPYSQCPPKIVRKDCIYYSTPAMVVPKAFENLHCCENWLPRRVISASRAAGIIHALEEWDTHECGDMVTSTDKVWHAALKHGFTPYNSSSEI